MSASASMAAVSAANASIAASASHRAKVSECKVIEYSFDSKIASISEKTEYVDCMNVLYPQAMSGDLTNDICIAYAAPKPSIFGLDNLLSISHFMLAIIPHFH